MNRVNKKHFLIYYLKEAGNYITTEPRLWAQANPDHFPKDDNPRTSPIEDYLISNFGFTCHETAATVVLYHFDINIPIGKNGKFFYKNSS